MLNISHAGYQTVWLGTYPRFNSCELLRPQRSARNLLGPLEVPNVVIRAPKVRPQSRGGSSGSDACLDELLRKRERVAIPGQSQIPPLRS